MPSDTRRKCIVRGELGGDRNAYFEMYGSQDVRDDANNIFPITMAIVEFLNGQVKMVEPQRIKFVSEFKEID